MEVNVIVEITLFSLSLCLLCRQNDAPTLHLIAEPPPPSPSLISSCLSENVLVPVLVHTVSYIDPQSVFSQSSSQSSVFPKTLCPFLQPIQTPTVTQHPASPPSLGLLSWLHPSLIAPLQVFIGYYCLWDLVWWFIQYQHKADYDCSLGLSHVCRMRLFSSRRLQCFYAFLLITVGF